MNLKNLKKTNYIVTDHARNNSQSYRVDLTKTVVYKYSFFPRTTIDWNNLEQEIVSSKTLASNLSLPLKHQVLPTLSADAIPKIRSCQRIGLY